MFQLFVRPLGEVTPLDPISTHFKSPVVVMARYLIFFKHTFHFHGLCKLKFPIEMAGDLLAVLWVFSSHPLVFDGHGDGDNFLEILMLWV